MQVTRFSYRIANNKRCIVEAHINFPGYHELLAKVKAADLAIVARASGYGLPKFEPLLYLLGILFEVEINRVVGLCTPKNNLDVQTGNSHHRPLP
jgi:hypothetical protein